MAENMNFSFSGWVNQLHLALDRSLMIRRHQIPQFKSKIEIHSEKGNYIIKTISTYKELILALQLRYRVFVAKDQDTPFNGLDVDEFDAICDHLAIIDKSKNKLVGTYRLNCSRFSDKFYSSTEYDISPIIQINANKLEIGRGCIHKDYRQGAVISLLWRGVLEYLVASQSQIAFGCVSVKTTEVYDALLLYKHFREENYFSPDFFCSAIDPFKIKGCDKLLEKWNQPLTEEEKNEAKELIPPLFRAYIYGGAKLCSPPIIDAKFQTLDFLISLKPSDMNPLHKKKYGFA